MDSLGKLLSTTRGARRLFSDSEGSTAVEYGVMMALIAAVGLASVQMVGRETSSLLNLVANELKNAGGSGTSAPIDGISFVPAPPQALQPPPQAAQPGPN